jgi:hypothetical protein
VPPREVRAGDGPELPAPNGEPGDESEHNECAERRDRPSLADPDQRIAKTIAPVDRRRERFELVHWNPTPASGDMVARKLPQVQFGGSGLQYSMGHEPMAHNTAMDVVTDGD